MYKVTVFCDHTTKSNVHCNRYLTVKVDIKDEIDDKIKEKGWQVLDDEFRCEDHHE